MAYNHRVDTTLIKADLLTLKQIEGLGNAECASLIAQLDQQLVRILQDTDANFLRATRAITDKVLPAVESYGDSSREIWQSVKLWKSFFEAAAGIRLAEPRYGAEEEREDEQEETVDQSTEEVDESASENQSISPYNDLNETTIHAASDTSSVSSINYEAVDTPASQQPEAGPFKERPALKPSWSDDASPFEMLQKDMHSQFGIESSSVSSNTPAGKSKSRSRLADLSMDSPDIIRPDLETMSLGDISKGKGREIDSPIPPTAAASKKKIAAKATAAARKSSGNDILLHKVLKRNPSQGPTASTPARKPTNKTQFPFSIPQDWDGLADLSKDSLNSYSSPSFSDLPRAKSLDDSDGGLSFPSMMHFSVNRAKLNQTPAKEAAKMVTRDVLETAAMRSGGGGLVIDSPNIEPPSVMKNWATRGYGHQDLKPPPQPDFAPASASHQQQQQQQPKRQPALARSSDLIRLDDTNEYAQEDSLDDEFAGALPEGEEDSFGADGLEEEDTVLEDSMIMQQQAAAAGREAEMSFDEPEDTVFGGKRKSEGLLRPDQQFLRGPEDMHTFHGGKLLESQPFEKSPLAGRDLRHGL